MIQHNIFVVRREAAFIAFLSTVVLRAAESDKENTAVDFGFVTFIYTSITKNASCGRPFPSSYADAVKILIDSDRRVQRAIRPRTLVLLLFMFILILLPSFFRSRVIVSLMLQILIEPDLFHLE